MQQIEQINLLKVFFPYFTVLKRLNNSFFIVFNTYKSLVEKSFQNHFISKRQVKKLNKFKIFVYFGDYILDLEYNRKIKFGIIRLGALLTDKSKLE